MAQIRDSSTGRRRLVVAVALAAVLAVPLSGSAGFADEGDPPLPDELLEARRICIMNSVMHFSLYSAFLTAIEEWDRFEIVDSPDESDVVMAISARPDFTTEEGGEGRAPGTVMVMDKLYFKVFQPGGEDLWVDEAELGEDDEAAAELVRRLRDRIEAEETDADAA